MEVKQSAAVPGSLFSQPWWLDAVAPGSWDAVTIERGGEMIARLPYVLRRHYGFTYITMPPLTQTLGPWLRPHTGKHTNRLSEEISLMAELIEGLPRFDRFEQRFHYSIVNWLSFYWEGFHQTTRYTYVIERLSDQQTLWEDLRKSVRCDIRKAEKQVRVRDNLDIDTFLNLNEMTFKRQGLPPPYTRELVVRLDDACREHGCRRILFAEDSQGQLHAAIYLVWDKQAAYYLMGGSNPELRTSGATSLLVWKAIQFSGTVSQSFDFEGSMIRGVERFFRAFGAQQRSYFRISKTTHPLLRAFGDIRSWMHFGGSEYQDSVVPEKPRTTL